MKTVLFFCLLVFEAFESSVVTTTHASDSCADKVEQCLQDVQIIIMEIIVERKPSETDLDRTCRYIGEVLECLSNCEKDIPKTSTIIYKKTKEFKNLFCIKGSDMRKLYLETIPCLNTKAKEVNKCDSDGNSGSKDHPGGSQPDSHAVPQTTQIVAVKHSSDNSKETCSNFCNNIECIYKISGKHCGSDGVKVMKAVMEPLIAVMDVNCKHTCSSGSNVIKFSNWFSIGVATTINLFLISRVL